MAYALTQFPDMRAAELGVTDAYLGLDLAKAARLPRVVGSFSLGSGYSQNRLEQIGESNTIFYDIATTTPGVLLTAPVVDDSGVSFETMSFQDQLSDNLNQSIFFSLSLPLFNNFSIHAGIEQAKVDVISAQLSKEQTAQSLTQTVQTSWADARTRLDNARINALRTQYDFVFKTRILDFYLGRPLSL